MRARRGYLAGLVLALFSLALLRPDVYAQVGTTVRHLRVSLGVASTSTGQLELFTSGAAVKTVVQGGATGADWTLTLPANDGDSGQFLKTNGSGVATWDTVTTTSTLLNSTSHTDTTTGTVARGDLITGQGVSATWTRLAIGAANRVLRSDGTDVAWAQVALATDVTGQLPLANGGTAANLVDPNADRILFWDDSAGAITFLAPGNSIAITDTTLDAIQDIRTTAAPTFAGGTFNGAVTIGGVTGTTRGLVVSNNTSTGAIACFQDGGVDKICINDGTLEASFTSGGLNWNHNGTVAIGNSAFSGTWFSVTNAAVMTLMGIGATNAQVLVGSDISTTNTVYNVMTLSPQTTGTGAVGLGTGLLFQNKSSTTADRDLGSIYAVWTTATDASRTSDVVLETVTSGAARAEKWRLKNDGKQEWAAVTQANLGTPANGTVAYCSDCTIANPCAGGGTGAIAKRLNGAWVCN